jgi:hypothetical protein
VGVQDCAGPATAAPWTLQRRGQTQCTQQQSTASLAECSKETGSSYSWHPSVGIVQPGEWSSRRALQLHGCARAEQPDVQ